MNFAWLKTPGWWLKQAINLPMTSPLGASYLHRNVSGLNFVRGGPTAIGTTTALTDQMRIGSSGLLLESDMAVWISSATPGSSGSLANGARYYRVSAEGAWGESNAGYAKGATVVAGPNGSVALTWYAVPNATGYRVYEGSVAATMTQYWDVGNVTSWTDTGTAGTAGAPSYSSTIVTEFLTLPSWRAFGPSHAFSGSLIIYPEWDQTAAGLHRTILYVPGNSSGSQYLWLYYNTGNHQFYLNGSGSGGSVGATSVAQTFSAGTPITLKWAVQDNAAPQLWVNGANYAAGGNYGVLSPMDVVYFGLSPTTLYNNGGAGMYTVAGYAGGLSAAVTNLQVALGGSTAASPTITNLVCLGDSTTLGTGLNPTYPQSLGTSLSGAGYTITNGGVGGYTSLNIMVLWQSTYRTSQGTVVLLAGTNDLGASGCSAEETYDNWRAVADEVLASGARLVVAPPLPRKGTANWASTQDAALLTFVGYLRTYAALRGVPFADTYTALNDGNGALQGAYDSGDHTHPSQAGANVMATTVYNAGHAAGYW